MTSSSQVSKAPIPDIPNTTYDVWMETTYNNWRSHLKADLLKKDLWDIIEWRIDNERQAERVDYETWKSKHDAALKEIRDSCKKPYMGDAIKEIKSAKIAWDTLAKMFRPTSVPRFNMGDPSEFKVKRLQKVPLYKEKIISLHYDRKKFTPLKKAIYRGDWDGVNRSIASDRSVLTAKLTSYGYLLIHAAAECGNVNIVRRLVALMSREELEIQNSYGRTALSFAAANGNYEMAECIVQKNNFLLQIADIDDQFPVAAACIAGHKEMTRYLYRQTPRRRFYPENGPHGSMLLYNCIINNMFDIALELLNLCPPLALSPHGDDKLYPYRALANTSSAFRSGCKLTFWKTWIYFCISIQLPDVSNEVCVNIQQENFQPQVLGRGQGIVQQILKFVGIQQIHDIKLTHTYALKVLSKICKIIAASDQENIGVLAFGALHDAINNGTVEYVARITEDSPDFLNYSDYSGKSLLMMSIAARQERIFSHLYDKLVERNYRQITQKDNCGNNALHVAAELAPAHQLKLSGATLQMQRELQWFKKVEDIMAPRQIESKNKKHETPRELFTKTHKELRKEGEEWMKETATSCTVVGALIITIMFAATFTVPGGIVEDTGVPLFLQDKWFMIFIISDAISLLSSSTSVLMFLGILTSRYAEEDFLTWLPTKLFIGLSMLFISIATMMATFCAALTLMLPGKFWLVIISFVLAGFPVTLFILLQFPLLVEIFKSTYGPSIFNKKIKYQY